MEQSNDLSQQPAILQFIGSPFALEDLRISHPHDKSGSELALPDQRMQKSGEAPSQH